MQSNPPTVAPQAHICQLVGAGGLHRFKTLECRYLLIITIHTNSQNLILDLFKV